jgi:mRNA-degrading endonuclease toxin of MazEF toxin-antitoxin module
MQDITTKIIQYFTDWAKLKVKIHFYDNPHAVYSKERQIWWASMGQNIGSEQNGKHKNFERPVLILKKFNAEMFLAVPISSQVKIGDYRYVFEREGMKYTANLSQMRVMSAKRLLRQLGKLAEEDFENIKQMFRKMT